MLPKEHRLKRKKDFQRVLKSGKTIKSLSLMVKYTLTDQPPKRLGFVVSKKVSLRATKRNKVKRWLRSIFMKNIALLPAADIVVIAFPAALNSGYKKLIKEVDEVLKKIQ